MWGKWEMERGSYRERPDCAS